MLHARTDPTLAIDGSGARLVAYLPSLAPHQTKKIAVAYSEALSGGSYRVRLEGLPKLDSLKASVSALGASATVAELDLHASAPSGDLVIPEARYRTTTPSSSGVSSQGSFVARVVVEGTPEEDPLLSPIVLLDTSAARALDLATELGAFEGLVSRLPKDLEIVVAAYDQEVTPIFEGKVRDIDAATLASIAERRGLGASDLGGAIEWAGRASLARNGLHHRLVLFGDGIPTAGQVEHTDLPTAARRLGDKGIDRLDVVAIGADRDADLLGALASDALPSRGVVIDVRRDPDDLLRHLVRKPFAPLEVAVEGAIFSWPRRITSAEPGDEVLVFGEVSKGASPSIRIGSSTTQPTLREGPKAVVEREVQRAKASSSTGTDQVRRATANASFHAGSASVFTFTASSGGAASGGAASGGEEPSLARSVAVERAFRLGDITITDEPPPRPKESEVIDPLDASLRTQPKVDVKVAAPKIEKAPKVEKPAKPEPPPTDTDPTPKVAAQKGSGLLPEVIQRIVRLNFGRFKACYVRAQSPKLEGRVMVKFVIDESGTPTSVVDGGSDIESLPMRECVASAFEALSFPAPAGGPVTVTYPIAFSPHEGPPPPRRLPSAVKFGPPPPPEEPEKPFGDPYSGAYASVMKKLGARDAKGALDEARRWQADHPDDVLAYLALGEAAEASGDTALAARAYGSILALWSYRADLARTAGARLSRLANTDATRIARDAFATAVALRPDHPTGQRLLAFSEVRLGRPEAGFRDLEHALLDNHASGRFVAAQAILAADLGIIGAAWARTTPERRAEIDRRTRGAGGRIESEPSLRALLSWETDTTSVDLKIADGNGDRAKRGRRVLPSGGELTTDIVEGYGPEAFVVRGAVAKRAYPYHLSIALPGKGSLGFAPASVEVIEHDGAGKLHFEERPFLVMNDHDGIELGEIVSPRE